MNRSGAVSTGCTAESSGHWVGKVRHDWWLLAIKQIKGSAIELQSLAAVGSGLKKRRTGGQERNTTEQFSLAEGADRTGTPRQ
jgi:hypothetical protein